MKIFLKKILVAALWLLPACSFAPATAAETALPDLARVEDKEFAAALSGALEAYEGVRDYEARFVKRERGDDGALEAPENIFFKFEKPFKLFMRWLDSRKEGLQIVYERGKNDGKLAIHKPGLALGLVPVVFLEQTSPWVREGSKSFDIEDAGIGTFLRDFAAVVARAAREGKLRVSGPREEGGRAYFDVEFPGSAKDRDYFAARVVAGFDAASRLPAYMELYDWEGRPIGTYEYAELRLNVGADAGFKKRMNGHLFKVYSRPAAEPDRGRSEPTNFAR